ncbi:MAG: Tad domain-containing protein [Nitrospiraceae bacterium]|nr:MAG: Tad domain-containing protein [Nitrospiraceae bacterium]
MKAGIKERLLHEGGMTLVWLALVLLILLILFASFAIDISFVYFAKNELQIAADAACLAGVAELDGTSDITQVNARQTAWEFACKNSAAGDNVYLIADNNDTADGQPCDDIPAAAVLNIANDNTVDDDIVVGNWDGSARVFTAASGTAPLNAMKIRARRKSNSPGGPVSLFLGGIFGLIGFDWSMMNVVADATCEIKAPPVTGISICLDTCSLSVSDETPVSLDLREQGSHPPSPFGLAWTELNQDSPIGTNRCVDNSTNCFLDTGTCGDNNSEEVAEIIWGLRSVPNICGQAITTKNGVSTVLDDLSCAFKSLTHDADNKVVINDIVDKWNVIVPVQEPCPAGVEPGPWPVVRYARLEIKGVFDGGTLKGIQITKIECVACDNISSLGGGNVALVQ